MSQTRTIKFFTKALLVAANDEAIYSNVAQAIAREALAALPDHTRIPVFQYHPLTLERFRVVLVMNEEGDIALLDCLRSVVARLPTQEMPIQ